ncbi:hypothetical protein HOY80DRAFT_1003015 [Tuber brumale]|nr:hypothetical protein HOY80DRAFT_1003015 [Tuber brumale]
MTTNRGRTAPSPFVVSGDLKPVQLASMEVAKEVWAMMGDENRENFVVVGGAALLLHGYPIITEDTDLAITPDSLHKFETLAMSDPRFSQTMFGEWSFDSPRGFRITIDFLDKTGESGSLHKCSDYSLIDGMPVVTLVDLAISKGGAWFDRQEKKDLYGFTCVVETMKERGLNFKRLSRPKRETLDDIMIELERMKETRELLRVVRTLL